MNTALVQSSVVDDLATFVRNKGYEAGDKLPPIRKLSRVLNVGRNVVRDALLEAQTMGLVKIEPRQGVFVQAAGGDGQANWLGRLLEKSLSHEEQNLFHLVDARLAVETEVAAEAARVRRPEELLPLRQALEAVLTVGDDRAAYIEADEKFHFTIARLAGNRVLASFLDVLWRLIRPAKSNLFLSPTDRRLSDREHQELFQAIVAGDSATARLKMDEHIRQGRALLLDYACTLPTAAGRRGETKSAPISAKKKNGGKGS